MKGEAAFVRSALVRVVFWLAMPLPFVSPGLARAPDEASRGGEIVVTAEKGRCKVIQAGIPLSDRALGNLAKGWPQEQPARIVEPRGVDYHCLAEIAFKLQRKGIRSIEFVQPSPSP